MDYEYLPPLAAPAVALPEAEHELWVQTIPHCTGLLADHTITARTSLKFSLNFGTKGRQGTLTELLVEGHLVDKGTSVNYAANETVMVSKYTKTRRVGPIGYRPSPC